MGLVSGSSCKLLIRVGGRGCRLQSHSRPDAEIIIGRDEDRKRIVDMLVDSNVRDDLSVLCIVGIGGLGKTTLAQMVYNDEKVKEHFELRKWVCVSDLFDRRLIVQKILKSTTNNIKLEKLDMEQLQIQLEKELSMKKYLLVLDDVWNEDPEEWHQLKGLLNNGKFGCRVLVTTQSREVARIMGEYYGLGYLSEEDSWSLFRKMAFEPGKEYDDPNLVRLGERIVKKCADVPLAIRTLGSLLKGKGEKKWRSCMDNELARIDEAGNIMSILKLSYQHLRSPLKYCFSFCALFPKDTTINKEKLIKLWMAHGFIVPSYENQSLEDVGEEFINHLLQRCFFQDSTRDEWGSFKSFKIHDLMHDLAKEVAGVECVAATMEMKDVTKRAYHLFLDCSLNSPCKIPRFLPKAMCLRTFLLPEHVSTGSYFRTSFCKFVSSSRFLRVLDLHGLEIESLPKYIGKLIHLRYLDLSNLPIKRLPNSITKLLNLQTLKLDDCLQLKEIPVNIEKLINLRHLSVSNCELAHMPHGICQLTSLHRLDWFLVKLEPVAYCCPSSKPSMLQLSDLKALNCLGGQLKISIRGISANSSISFQAMEASLTGKCNLLGLHIEMDLDDGRNDKAILEGLQPHHNLRKLLIEGYGDDSFPNWASLGGLSLALPNLLHIELNNLPACRHLPSYGELAFLESLTLLMLEKVEYMETGKPSLPPSSTSQPATTLCFPSLKRLTLFRMYELKGWLEALGEENQHLSWPSFPKLSKLSIINCPKLQSMPFSPFFDDLRIVDVGFNLPMAMLNSSKSKLKALTTDKVDDLVVLPTENLQMLSSLCIQSTKLETLSNLKPLCKGLSSLPCLEICCCSVLKSLPQCLEHLTSLNELKISFCEKMDLSTAGMESNRSWMALKNLCYLTLDVLPKLSALPEGLQYLTFLRSLKILYCENLVELPEWISSLVSLQILELSYCHNLVSLPEGIKLLNSLVQLDIVDCPGLYRRCRSPNGEDWFKIQHIPLLSVRSSL